MENRRTTDARDTDDHALIDAAVADADPEVTGLGGGGGGLRQDMASQVDLARAIDNPTAGSRPKKADDQHNHESYPAARGPNRQ